MKRLTLSLLLISPTLFISHSIKPMEIAQETKEHLLENPRNFTARALDKQDPLITRQAFVDDVLGLSEADFRTTYGWDEKAKTLSFFDTESTEWFKNNDRDTQGAPAQLLAWIKEYPRRAALFAGRVSINTLEEITKEYEKKAPTQAAQERTPRFIVQLHDFLNPDLTDVRFLMELPENKHAGFQVASTFYGMLEGGMNNPYSLLTNMLHAAAQGEEISVTTAPATLYRKYFNPQGYLLESLQKKKPNLFLKDRYNAPFVDTAQMLAYTYEDSDKECVSAGLHVGASVASGRALTPTNKPLSSDQQRQVPMVVDNGLFDQDKNQTVNLVFTSAHSIRGKDSEKYAQDPHVADFCGMILEASYALTLKMLALTEQPKVFLTLMGASAFSNPISWVGCAINREEIKDTITRWGLDVTLIYRMDYKPHRNAEKDAEFLIQMFSMGDLINGKTSPLDDSVKAALKKYTHLLYEITKDQKGLQELYKERSSKLAQRLMEYQYTHTLPEDTHDLLQEETYNHPGVLETSYYRGSSTGGLDIGSGDQRNCSLQ